MKRKSPSPDLLPVVVYPSFKAVGAAAAGAAEAAALFSAAH